MFQLRDEHEEAFKAAALAGFERRAVAHIRANFPKQASKLSDDEIRRRARDGQQRSKAYGFGTERQVMCFVDTEFLIGENFDSRRETAWTRSVLNQPATAEDRARALLAEAQRVINAQAIS